MTAAPTAEFDELVIEVEFTADSGTYTKVCGMADYTTNRTNNTATSEVPDCSDESLPHTPKRGVVSQDYAISGTGVWARTHWKDMHDWWKSGATKNVRIRHIVITEDGSSGDPEIETIPMILQQLNNARTKGQVVSAEITLEQDGPATITDIA